MRKLTPNQSAYLKQINRIRTNLSKLRKQGYDISDLADIYTTKLPSRVTSKMLSDLQSITPKKLRQEVKNKFVGVAPSKYTDEGKRTVTRLNVKPTAYKRVQETAPDPKRQARILVDQPEKTILIPKDPTNPYSNKIPLSIPEVTFADFMMLPETEEEQAQTTETIVDEIKGKIYTIDKLTGEILSEQDIAPQIAPEPEPLPEPEPTPDTYDYTDFEDYTEEEYPFTPIQNEYIPDLSEQAYEYLLDLITSGYEYNVSSILREALDKMIQEKGMSEFYQAFTETMNDRPNMVEQIVNSRYERYKGSQMAEFMGEIAEKLDIDINLKEALREEISRESMADIGDTI